MQFLQTNNTSQEEYTKETAHVIGTVMSHYSTALAKEEGQQCQFAQTYRLRKGLNKFGNKGKKAVNKELSQLHSRNIFEPIHIKDLTLLEKKRAIESLIFLTEKRDMTIKARACANGSTQRLYIAREEAA
eukprot:1211840-Ditylum_brightwellii.AAC.2